MNLSQVVLRIEFQNYLPIYLIVKRIHWIYQYFTEIAKYLRKNESFLLSLKDSKQAMFVNLGTLYDLYSTDQVLTLYGEFTHQDTEQEFKDLFLQSLKESEFLSQGSIAKIQSLSVDQVKNLLNVKNTRELDQVLNFPIKIYVNGKIVLKKFSKEYMNESLQKVIQELYPGYDLIYFGVLLDKEFKFSDVLKVLTPDQWFHLVLKDHF